MKELIKRAIAYIASLVASIGAAHDALEEKDKKIADQADLLETQANIIENLRAQVAADDVDDAELERAAKEAREGQQAAQAAAAAAAAKTVELQTQLDEITTVGEELRSAINDHPETPVLNEDWNEDAPATESQDSSSADAAGAAVGGQATIDPSDSSRAGNTAPE